MRNRIDLQTIIKYLAIPNFIMGSGNVAYNLYYKNRVEAAILRKKHILFNMVLYFLCLIFFFNYLITLFNLSYETISCSLVIINREDNLKNLFKLYKNFIDDELYVILSKYDTLSELKNDLTNLIHYNELRLIIDKINLHETKLNLLYNKGTEYINSLKRHEDEYGEFSGMIDNTFIDKTYVTKLTTEQYDTMKELLFILNSIKDVAMESHDLKYYSSKGYDDFFKNEMKESENDTIEKEKRPDFIFARISDLSLTKDRSTSRSLHMRHRVVANDYKFYKPSNILFNVILNKLKLNLRNNMIGSVTTFFTDDILVAKLLGMFRFDSRETVENNRNFLEKLIKNLKINGIYIIYSGDADPIFNRIILNKERKKEDQIKTFGFNILGLDDLCLLMLTLSDQFKEIHSLNKSKKKEIYEDRPLFFFKEDLARKEHEKIMCLHGLNHNI